MENFDSLTSLFVFFGGFGGIYLIASQLQRKAKTSCSIWPKCIVSYTVNFLNIIILQMEDNFDIVKKLIDTPWYNVILISLLVVPTLLGAWIALLKSLEIEMQLKSKKNIVIGFIVVYCLGLTISKIGRDYEQEGKLNNIAKILEPELRSAGGFRGFARIQFNHPKYDDNLLFEVAERFPEKFVIASVADPIDPTKQNREDPVGLLLRK